ncbi:MAG TPA: acetylglutamate kinase [Myxococcota bacterium]|jgi:acetylglutamate kinase|nr:acetylglutamate kinase [Myxococcota bacterium]
MSAGLPARGAPTAVVKVGGEVVADPTALANLGAGLRALAESRVRLAVVHGGGPQASALQKRLGFEPQVVAGRRITDDAALEAVEMAVAGHVNVRLCAALRAAGLRAVGISGSSAGLVDAVRRPPRVVSGGGPDAIDFGHVGDVVSIGVDLLEALWSAGFVPVVACLGSDAAGRVYNINADVVANALAGAVSADHLLLVTSAPGILSDPDDPNTRLSRLTHHEARAAIASGSIRGGMIPKVEESLAGLAGGVRAVHVLSAAAPDALAREVRDPGSVGTVILP